MNNDIKIKNWISEIKVRSKILLNFMPQLRFLTSFEMTATAVMSGGVGRRSRPTPPVPPTFSRHFERMRDLADAAQLNLLFRILFVFS